MPAELRERYFERSDTRLAFRKDLRRTVIFGRNNLVQDAPISRLDLLVCRNTLMYFTAETQARILRHFHFALRAHGVLMLGKSEMMISHRDLFTPLDMRAADLPQGAARHAAGPRGHVRRRRRGRAPAPRGRPRHARRRARGRAQRAARGLAQRACLTFANLAARALFGIPLEDIGRPLSELAVARRPVELVRARRAGARRAPAHRRSARSRSRPRRARSGGSTSRSRRCCRAATRCSG